MRVNRRKPDKSPRTEIAHAAARMLAEGTAETFAEAKQRAAEMLGLGRARKLPENIVVHEALIEYQALFGGEAHRERIREMRRRALEAMQALSAFEPRLVGPVLYGTACDYSPVTLHLYTDEFEAVARFLHEHAIDYRVAETRLTTQARTSQTFPSLEVLDDGLAFDIVVLPEAFLAHPPVSSLDGKPFRRASVTSLQQILDGADPAGIYSR